MIAKIIFLLTNNNSLHRYKQHNIGTSFTHFLHIYLSLNYNYELLKIILIKTEN